MAHIVTGKLFRMIFAVGNEVRQPIIVEAESPTEADEATMLHASQEEGYSGQPIRILSMAEFDSTNF